VSAARVFERIGGKRTVRPVSFRVSEDTRVDGERAAAEAGLTIGQLARQLLLRRLAPPAPGALATRAEVSTPDDDADERGGIRVVYDE
jgi:hypothetical protein